MKQNRLTAEIRAAANRHIKERDYWLEKFSGDPVKSSFPADTRRAGASAGKTGWETFAYELPGSLSSKLIELGKGSNHVLHIYLTAGVMLLLSRYSRHEDIIISTPIYRQEVRVDEDFLNTLVPLRVNLGPEVTFKELLRRVRAAVMDAVAHQNYPVELLAEQLEFPLPHNGGFPLFDTAVVLENIQEKRCLEVVKHRVIFSFARDKQTITGNLEYQAQEFSTDLVQQMVRHFLRLLQGGLACLDGLAAQIDILSEEERQKMLLDFNRTDEPFPADKRIERLFRCQAQKTPRNPAVTAPPELDDVYRFLDGSNEEGSLAGDSAEKILRCRFRRNPYVHERDIELKGGRGTALQLKLLKTHRHNSIFMNRNLYRLLDLLDNSSASAVFSGLKGQHIPVKLFPTAPGDILEIQYQLDRETELVLGESLTGFVRVIGLLYRTHLLELSGLEPEPGTIEKNHREIKADYFDPAVPGVSRELLEELLAGKTSLTPARVLLLGDTPGMPTTGLLYLASYLQRSGIDARVRFYDPYVDLLALKENIRELLAVICPQIVAVSMKWFLHIARVQEICKIVKEYSADIIVVVGGNTASYYPGEVIDGGNIDYLIRGDGEEPLLQICRGEAHISNCTRPGPGEEPVHTPITYIEDRENGKNIYLSHLDKILLSQYAPLLGSFFIYTHKGCMMDCLYCGGCRQAHRKKFNRSGFYRRGTDQVRRDIREALPYTSTFFFDFDAPNERLVEYCREIWAEFDLSGHFCILGNLVPPSQELITLACKTFKYVYWNLDIASLSERHRLELFSRGEVKPQPKDEEIEAFFRYCSGYDNTEIRINLIAGLPFFTAEDIVESEQVLNRLITTYKCFGELHWARLHAQPGAPVTDQPGKYGMVSHARTFADFLAYSQKNYDSSNPYPGMEYFDYPYIYYREESLNSQVSKHYLDMNQWVEDSRVSQRRKSVQSNSLTYEQLDRCTDGLAVVLNQKGVQSGDIVGLMAETPLELTAGIFGILKAGAAYLPIDPAYPIERVRYMLEDSMVKVLFKEGKEDSGKKPAASSLWNGEVLDLHALFNELPAGTAHSTVKSLKADSGSTSPAYVIYTSGTTGRPRGVVVNHQGIVNYTQWRLDAYNYSEKDVTLQLLSYSFDGFNSNFYSSLLSGGKLVMLLSDKRLDMPFVRNMIMGEKVTNISLVPAIYSAILAVCRSNELNPVRFIVLAGEQAQPHLLEVSRKKAPHLHLINEYGPTEASVTATANLEMNAMSPGIIGQPIANTHIFILDSHLNALPLGVPGELCIASPGVAQGYLNNPDLTRKKFCLRRPGGLFLEKPPPWTPRKNFLLETSSRGKGLGYSYLTVVYRTGDLSRWLTDGRIEYLGRMDRQLKVRGFRIEPGEIEARITGLPGVRETVVIDGGEEDKDFLAAYVVCDEDIIIEELKEYLTGELPGYMVPGTFTRVERIPLTPGGKVDRRALPQMEIKNSYVPPRNPTENRLVELWSEVLGVEVEKIGIETNFFEIGGHSLNTTVLISKIQEAFQVTIPHADVFRLRTIQALAEIIMQKKKTGFVHTSRLIPIVEKKEYYPLSPAQQRLFFLDRMGGTGIGYNTPMIMKIQGSVDKKRFANAFNQLVSRHEVLRTSFHLVGSQPVQIVHHGVELAVTIEKENDREQRGPERIAELVKEFIRPFDLSAAPLLRVKLAELSNNDFLFLSDMHHIIADGTSMAVLTDDFTRLYAGELLPVPRIHYKEFAAWQDSLSARGEIQRQLGYWKQVFSAGIPRLHLPLDNPRPRVFDFKGGHFGFSSDRVWAARLKKLARETNTTFFMNMLAVFSVLLYKYSHMAGEQTGIVVGSPVGGRRHADLHPLVGFFVNQLAFRCNPQGSKSFRYFLEEIKTISLAAFENQDVPFEEVVEHLNPPRDTSRNPLFDVCLVVQNPVPGRREVKDVSFYHFQHERSTAKFDLTLTAIEGLDGITFDLEYWSPLFKSTTIQRMAGHFFYVLQQVVNDADIPIAAIEIPNEKEKQQLLEEFNNTDMDSGIGETVSVWHWFAGQCQEQPHRAAVASEDEVVTYGYLYKVSAVLASRMSIEKKVCWQEPVGVLLDRSILFIGALLGVLRLGAVYVPLEPGLPQERLKRMVRDSCIKTILTRKEYKDQARFLEQECGESLSVLYLDMDLNTLISKTDHTTHIEEREFRSNDLMYLLYTSGSTGMPRGVMVENRGFINFVACYRLVFGLDTGSRVSQVASTGFDAMASEVWPALCSGAVLDIAGLEYIRDPAMMKKWLIRRGITVSFQPTLMVEHLLAMDWPEQSIRLRALISAGDRLTRYPEKQYAFTLYNNYGPTENTIWTTYCPVEPTDDPRPNPPIGRPIANHRVYILGNHLELQPVGTPGELCITGPGLARGYLNNPELTNKKFLQGVQGGGFYKKSPPGRRRQKIYKTGDLARWLEDGNLEFLGRLDFQVKIRGFRIEPGEIEFQLLKHSKVKKAYVTSGEEKGDKYLCAYVEVNLSNGGNLPDIPGLRTYLSGLLPAYMVPDYIVLLESFPLLSSGKIDPAKLPGPVGAGVDSGAGYVEPQSEMERQVAQVWQEELSLDRVGTNDNFFDIGGNSLKIIRVNSRLKKLLDLEIPVMKHFQHPSVGSLARYLVRLLAGAGGESEAVPEAVESGGAGSIVESGDIAVIGMAGRFPGAGNIGEFWNNLVEAVECISVFTEQELVEAGISPELLQAPGYVKSRGIIGDKEYFDAPFFNYTPHEARLMDPQMRIFHECTWEALEDGGYNPDAYEGAIGLYAGAANNFNWEAQVRVFAGDSPVNPFEKGQLMDRNFLSTRISYKLNLKGPAYFLQTACSTSLAAVHLACNALLIGDCNMALAGGVTLSFEKKSGYFYREGMVASPDGHCRAFDGAAGGTVGGDGAAVVLLKPLEQALDHNDHIYAVIKASAANNDGSRKVGYSAPSIEGQAEVIRRVYRRAGVKPETIAYIEAHGTGTELGDPIEVEALKQAFNTKKRGFCALGSVKSNVGHLDAAAGAAGLIKVALAIKHRRIPPTLHFNTPNQQIDLVDSPFYINSLLQEWTGGSFPLRAGVSSFGIGGTNAHVLLEEAPEPAGREKNEVKAEGYLLVLSAKSPEVLENSRHNLARFLETHRQIPVADVAYTLQVGRKAFSYRWMAVCSSVGEAIEALTGAGAGETGIVPASGTNGSTGVIRDGTGVDRESLLQAGRLWLRGREINWQEFYSGGQWTAGRRVPLPTYPFSRQPYWIEGSLSDLLSPRQEPQIALAVKKPDITDWFYVPDWVESPLPLLPFPEQDNRPLNFLVLISGSSLEMQVVEQLRSAVTGTGQGHVVVTAVPGEEFKELRHKEKKPWEFVINPRWEADYQRLLTQLSRKDLFPGRIIHLWNVSTDEGQLDTGRGDEFGEAGFFSLVYLVRAIGDRDFSGEIRLDVVTASLREVSGSEKLNPGKAVVLGPLKVIPQEYPYIVCRSIDIDIDVLSKDSSREGELAHCLVDECLRGIDTPDTDIAYRGSSRWTLSYKQVRLEPGGDELTHLHLKEQGVYLITGGCGNIGFTLAEYLANRVQARLVLTGTTPLPPREQWEQLAKASVQAGEDPADDAAEAINQRIKKIRRLEAAGGKVLYFAADTADKTAMAGVIREAGQTFGPVDGVIHAAGVTRDRSVHCPIAEVTEKEWTRQIRPKIQGTMVLAELFQGRSLEFCLLTSSLSPILGGLGFAAYSAANAFMDAFVHRVNRGNARHWISVNWADWDFRAPGQGRQGRIKMGAETAGLGITPDEGMETFKRILGLLPEAPVQVAVSAGDLHTRINRWVKLDTLRSSQPATAAAGADSSASPFHPRPPLSAAYQPPQTHEEQAVADIWQQLFGIQPIGIRDDFFELGGDSLKAISVISKIHQELDARVQLEEFFSRPTVETLARFITAGEAAKNKDYDRYARILPVEKREYYQLSPAQKRLYVLQQMENLETSYNMPMVFRLIGDFDSKGLERVFAALIKRHESFRTLFIMTADGPVQRVQDEVSSRIEYRDFQATDSSVRGLGQGQEPEQEKINLLVNQFIRPFDLSVAPLLRVGLVRLDQTNRLLMVDMHHTICDGVSHQILIKEFLDLLANRTLSLLPLRYKDYSQWQNSPAQRQAIKKQEDYWLGKITADLPQLELPADYPRPLVRSFAGGLVGSELSGEETKQLNEIGRSEGSTLFMVLLAIFNIVLARLSGQGDIPVGTSTAGRRHTDLETIIGMFVNTLVLRSFPLPEKSFRTLLAEVKKLTLEAFENQDYPFEELVEKRVKQRDTSRNPLFDVMFILQSQAKPGLPMPDSGTENSRSPEQTLEISPLPREKTSSPFDLLLDAYELPEGLRFSFQYCSKVFRRETIERFICYFKTVILAVTRNPGVKIFEIDIVPEKEKRLLLENFNSDFRDYLPGKTLDELFVGQVGQAPDYIILSGYKLQNTKYKAPVYKEGRGQNKYKLQITNYKPGEGSGEQVEGLDDVQLSYAQLNEKADRLAYYLREKGVKSDVIVGIMVERSVEMIISILGIVKAGGGYLPIDPQYPEERQKYMLADSGVKVVVTSGSPAKEATPNIENTSIETFEVLNFSSSQLLNFSSSHPADLAYIIYTSGSTGRPRGVAVNHENVVSLVCYSDFIRYWEGDRLLLTGALAFDISTFEIWGPLLKGVCLYLAPQQVIMDSGRLNRFMRRHRISILHLIPQLFNQVAAERIEIFAGLRYFLVGGDLVQPGYVNALRGKYPKINILHMYGPTENTTFSTFLPVDRDYEQQIPIGKPLSDCYIYILDSSPSLVPIGVVGEICVSGGGTARGYLNNPELTLERFINYKIQNNQKLLQGVQGGGFLEKSPPGRRRQIMYRTGDRGRWLVDGNIEFLGRIDRQVKIRGFRIECGEIERQLLEHETVSEVVVTAVTDRTGDMALCAYIILEPAVSLETARLKEHLSRCLPDYMIPAYFMELEQLPLTGTGKIDRRQLPGPRVKIDSEAVLPVSQKEKIIARAWQEVLQLEQVGIHDNFFDLGGNSLNIVRLNNRLKESFAMEIPLVNLFRYPTIHRMARSLFAGAEIKEQPAVYSETQRGVPAEVRDGLAVIGMAGRFPGAKDIWEFWENIKNGIEAISFFSDEEMTAAGVGEVELEDPDYIKARGILSEKEYFEAAFFGYIPTEAEVMDPQMRLFHYCVWEALEDAGYNPETYSGLIGIYAGASSSFRWEAQCLLSGKNAALGQFAASQLSNRDFLSTRISYRLNLRGPAVAVQTACSTSLTAIHMACRALLEGECHMALAGGVTVFSVMHPGYRYQEGMIMSPDGHCRPFDRRAAGTISSEGAGVVLIKPLARARNDRDHIYAVVRGTAVNNDGSGKVGFTAPGVEGQTGVIRAALDMANIEPETVTYIETHGTGTPMGDPIEIEALKLAFNTGQNNYCAVGSVKGNIGHTDCAAGAAGFIKAVLSLNRAQVPPSLHFETHNPAIDFNCSPFYVNTGLKEWPADPDGIPRRAGVSAFGIGGTNAHVILEEAPVRPPSSVGSRSYQLLVLSAKTRTALDTMSLNLASHLKTHLKTNPGFNLADVAYTLQQGRKAFAHRRMVVCNTDSEAATKILENPDSAGVVSHSLDNENQSPPVVFLFSGLGGQYVNMGRELYEQEPLFRREMDRCFEILQSLTGLHLEEILYPTGPFREGQLNRPEIAQPLVFIFEYALAQLIMSWGIKPASMMGYSFGEYTAACAAGVFSLEDALRLVVIRGESVKKTQPGIMLSVPLSREGLSPLMPSDLYLSIDNGDSCVVSGLEEAVQGFERELKNQGLISMRLSAAHAIHSPLMEPILAEFSKAVDECSRQEPTIPLVTNVTGDWHRTGEMVKAEYWADHLSGTVQFARGLQTLSGEPGAIFIEIGPGSDISALVMRSKNQGQQVINLVRPAGRDISDSYYLLNKIGRLWLYGVMIDWEGFRGQEQGARIPLPTYPFQGQPYWLKAVEAMPAAVQEQSKELSDWFYIPGWKRAPETLHRNSNETLRNCRWLVFSRGKGIGVQVIRDLREKGHRVMEVRPGKRYRKPGVSAPDRYLVNPRQPDHYRRLLGEVVSGGGENQPLRVIHLWSLDPVTGQSFAEKFAGEQETGFYSLLNLSKAFQSLKSKTVTGLHLDVIVRGVYEVTGQEELYPENALIPGLLKVIPQENPNILCRCIDIELSPPGHGQEILLIRHLSEEILNHPLGRYPEPVVSLRGNYRWLPIYTPLHLGKPEFNELPLRKNGVYLIIGGLGNIGYTVARYLAKTINPRIILTGRPHSGASSDGQTQSKVFWGVQGGDFSKKPPWPPEAVKKINQLEAEGARVMFFRADVSDIGQMQEVVRQVEEKWGVINGVVHLAGISQQESSFMLEELDENRCWEQFRVKALGTVVLSSLFLEKQLDFCWYMSSLSSVLGGLRFGAYAAANSFIDAFVKKCNRRVGGNCWKSVNWEGMPEVESVAAFERVLSLTGVQQVVTARGGNLEARIERWLNQGALHSRELPRWPGIGEDTPQTDLSNLKPRPSLINPFEPPVDPVQQVIARIWRQLFGFEKIGIHDDFFELGGDSLKLIKLTAGLQQEFNARISLSEAYKLPTIKQVADHIVAHKFESDREELVVLLNQAKAAKVFCFPPAVGYGITFMEFSTFFRQHALYAFNFIENRDILPGYVEIINEVQPEGPCVLMAYSAGGKLCLKATEILESQGRSVSDIIMLDCGFGQAGDEADREEFDRLLEEYIRSMNRSSAETGETGMAAMFKNAAQKMRSYYEFLMALECRRAVDSVIHYIKSEPGKRQRLEEPEVWQGFAGRQFIIYQGHGTHERMLEGEHVKENALLVQRILAGINGKLS